MKILKYGGYLIAGYLVLNFATGFGRDVSAATTGTAKVVKVFQGRG
jgi:hypothetical protein